MCCQAHDLRANCDVSVFENGYTCQSLPWAQSINPPPPPRRCISQHFGLSARDLFETENIQGRYGPARVPPATASCPRAAQEKEVHVAPKPDPTPCGTGPCSPEERNKWELGWSRCWAGILCTVRPPFVIPERKSALGRLKQKETNGESPAVLATAPDREPPPPRPVGPSLRCAVWGKPCS